MSLFLSGGVLKVFLSLNICLHYIFEVCLYKYIYIHIYHITQYENSRKIVSILQFSTILENFQIFHHFLYCLQPIVLSTLLPAPTIAYLCSTAPYVMLTSLSGVVTLKKKNFEKPWSIAISILSFYFVMFCRCYVAYLRLFNKDILWQSAKISSLLND